MSKAIEAHHIIDPDGDTVIILQNPDQDFAVWNDTEETLVTQMENKVTGHEVDTGRTEEPDDWGSFSNNQRERRRKQRREKRRMEEMVGTEISTPPRAGLPNDELQHSMEGAVVGLSNPEPPATEGDADTELGAHDPQDLSDTNGNLSECLERAIVYRVSSRHLVLSSGYFGKVLGKTWAEGQSNEFGGLYQVYAEDWDSEAFLILMDILHLRNSRVPRKITLELLAKFAVLVDYYRCQEAVEVFSRMWVDTTKTTHAVPSCYSRDLILWMWVAWVFKLEDVFETTTRLALKQCKTPVINPLSLPIPSAITSKIEYLRYQLLEEIISSCHSWIDKFRDGWECEHKESFTSQQQMNHYCGSVLLGALIKETDRLGLYSPRPQLPFEGHSIDSVESGVQSIMPLGWCFHISDSYRRYSSHGCNLRNIVVPGIEALVSGIQGLKLDQFGDRAYDA